MMPTPEKAPTYLQRDTADKEKDRYVFISYSHADSDNFVFPILRRFHAAGVNYWYDAIVRPGEEWDKVVLEIIQDEKCVGAVFFLSPKLINSEAVSKEVKAIQEKMRNNKGFLCFSINRDNKSLARLVKDHYSGPKQDPNETAEGKKPTEAQVEVLQLHRIVLLAQLFPSNKNFVGDDLVEKEVGKHTVGIANDQIDPNDLVSPENEKFMLIMDTLRGVGAVNDIQSISDELKGKQIMKTFDGVDIILFGNRKGIKRGDREFSPNPISWIVLDIDTEKNIITLISEHLLDAGNYDNTKKFLENLHDPLRRYLNKPPRLLKEAEFNSLKKIGRCKAAATEYAKLANGYGDTNDEWWMDGQRVVSNGSVLSEAVEKCDVLCIRPVIEITVDELKECYRNNK